MARLKDHRVCIQFVLTAKARQEVEEALLGLDISKLAIKKVIQIIIQCGVIFMMRQRSNFFYLTDKIEFIT